MAYNISLTTDARKRLCIKINMPKMMLNTKDLGSPMVWNKHTTGPPFFIYSCLDLAALAMSAQQLLPVGTC